MEVDAHTSESATSADFETIPSCSTTSNSSFVQVTAMDAEDVVQQHIREASQSPNSVPILTRFVGVLDQLDTRVERLRKDAMSLQEKRDHLFISLDLIKNNDLFSNLEEHEREEINYYMERVSSRLATVELTVRTVRNQQQEDCLHQVNIQIDNLINSQDAIMSRQYCQMYLNACLDEAKADANGRELVSIDKKFENALLGCTLDDQKEIKKRLTALMTYFNKRTVCE